MAREQLYSIDTLNEHEAKVFCGAGRKRVMIAHLTQHPRSPKDLMERAHMVIDAHRALPEWETIVVRK